MSNEILMYLLIGIGVIFVVIVIAYLMIRKKLQSSGVREIQKLRAGTEEKKFTKEILYQKLYVKYLKILQILVRNTLIKYFGASS